MENNTYTKVVTKGFGQNVKDSFAGVIIGGVLFIASIIVLWFNEGHCIKQFEIANYVNKNTIPVNSTLVDKNNDNKLISTHGNAVTEENLSDGIVTALKSLALNRRVEMYQWEEEKESKTKTEVGGSSVEKITYRYNKVWDEFPINSRVFQDHSYVNPEFPIQSERYNAQTGKLGDFELSDTQTSSLKQLKDFLNLPPNKDYKIYENYYYNGNNFNSPNIGDIRISYEYMPSNSPISVIGMQRPDKTITPMVTDHGNIYIQYDGIMSQNEMIEKFKKDNILWTNIFRLVGFLLMFFGLGLILKPLSTVLSFIPIFASIVSAITGGLVFLISIGLSLIVIALAWMYYKPYLTVGIIAVVVIVAIQIKKKIAEKQNYIDKVEIPENRI